MMNPAYLTHALASKVKAFLVRFFLSRTSLKLLFVLWIFLIGSAYFFHSSKEKRIWPYEAIETMIKENGQPEERLLRVRSIEGGFTNYLWLVDTAINRYIFRVPKKKDCSEQFLKALNVSKKAFEHRLGPRVFGENVQEQYLLMEYIENTQWPSYLENPQPYQETMKILKSFHEKMKPHFRESLTSHYAPFSFILTEGKVLQIEGVVPVHFSLALNAMSLVFNCLRDWLDHHATLCHGDFHQGNVLLSKYENTFTPFLIDFDSVEIGHPFFDVVKFSAAQEDNHRQKIFQDYLGGRPATFQEKAHFHLLDLAHFMVIAIVRFGSVRQMDQDSLSIEEMESLLDFPHLLPSFLSVPFEDQSSKARQLGAIYALGEVLKKINDSGFHEQLEAAGF